MPCDTKILKGVPLFSLLDDDELAILAEQTELRTFSARQRIYKMGDPAGTAYVVISGTVQVTTIDQDQQDVVFEQPASGDFLACHCRIEDGQGKIRTHRLCLHTS